MNKIKMLSFFSGIGAFEKALEKLGVEYELIGYSEIDKYASKAYALIHNVPESKNLGDISKIDTSTLNISDLDLLTYGFPCQDISSAGKQKGLFNSDGTKTRSGLFFEALRIIEDLKPKYAVAENVKNLTSNKFRKQFDIILKSLEEAGYNNYYQVLNSKDFGIPQNRDRVFIVSIRKDIDKGFCFPKGFPLKKRLKDLLEEHPNEKYYLDSVKNFFIMNSLKQEAKGNGFRFSPHVRNNANIAKTLTTRSGSRMDDNYIVDIEDEERESICFNKELLDLEDSKVKCLRLGNIYGENYGTGYAGNVWSKKGLSPTLTTGSTRQPLVMNEDIKLTKLFDIPKDIMRDFEYKRRVYSLEGQSPTITVNNSPKILCDLNIRKLTPKECFRLMGFEDRDFEILVKNGISDTQLYRMAGNSIVVDVLEAIFKNLLLDKKKKVGFCF